MVIKCVSGNLYYINRCQLGFSLQIVIKMIELNFIIKEFLQN